MPRPLRPTVGSPEDWQQYDQIARLKQEASDAGTYSAARSKTTRKLNYQQRIERSYLGFPMAEEKKQSRKQTFRELAEAHGRHVDPSDTQARSRNKRMLDNLYAAGLRLEEPGISDVARGSAIKATQDYLDRTGGKPITPIEQTLNVVHKSPEESAAAILEMLGQKKKESTPAQQAAKPQTIQ